MNVLVPTVALFACTACLGTKAASTSTPSVYQTAQRALPSDTATARATVDRAGIARWQPGVYYRQGALVTVDTALYRCAMTHTSETGWEPAVARALWNSEG